MSRHRFRPALAAVTLAAALLLGCEPTNQGYAPTQPIAYSHAVHAGALQIPCQYCHYAAERGPHAGIPPAAVCLNCHREVSKEAPEIVKLADSVAKGEPILWVRVHQLADFVYFHHGRHVAANLACQECHGPVESMGQVEQWAPLTMGWCIECHRRRGVAIPEDGPGPKVERTNRLTDCAVCHH